MGVLVELVALETVLERPGFKYVIRTAQAYVDGRLVASVTTEEEIIILGYEP